MFCFPILNLANHDKSNFLKNMSFINMTCDVYKTTYIEVTEGKIYEMFVRVG